MPSEQDSFTKRIGFTNYRVSVHFSKTSRKTINDKILRLVKTAQLAREIALPAELTREQNISLVREYVKQHFVAAGMCADICVHDTGGNPHVHILLTMCPFEQDGEWGGEAEKEYILDPQGNKIHDPKKRNTNVIPYPPPTGTSRPKQRNGGRRGLIVSMQRWSKKVKME